MPKVFILRATTIEGRDVECATLVEVSAGLAAALVADGTADPHPDAVAAATERQAPLVQFAVDEAPEAAVAAPSRKRSQ